MTEKKVVCIAGKNDIAVEVLEYLLKRYYDECEFCVVCNRTETGKNTWQKSLRLYANENDVPEYRLEEVYGVKNLIFFSLEFDRIIKPNLFLSNELYNIHFSLLPAYKGMYTSALPILNNEKTTGVTLHYIDQGIDTGDIIAQKEFEILYDDTSRDVYMKCLKKGTELVISSFEDILHGKVSSYRQPYLGSSYYSKKAINYSNLEIDLNQTAENVRNQIRAFAFKEYQMPIVYNRAIKSADITNEKSMIKPGTIVCESSQGMRLATIDYDIFLHFV